MPQVIWTEPALQDLQRLSDFLRPNGLDAARRAAAVIGQALRLLASHPLAGRPTPEIPACRELPIPFGARGYVCLYRPDGDRVVALVLRAGPEAGYREPI